MLPLIYSLAFGFPFQDQHSAFENSISKVESMVWNQKDQKTAKVEKVLDVLNLTRDFVWSCSVFVFGVAF